MQATNNEFDAIVVGSGPAGATVARELSQRKKKVLILERGRDAPLTDGFLTIASVVRAVSIGDKLASMSALTAGGTTAIYFAVADCPPLNVFRSLGIDLAGALNEARRELPLAVLPDELIGAQAIKVRDSAMELGYSWNKKTMLIDLAKCASGYAYDAKWNARTYLHEAVADGATLITRARVLRVLVEKNQAVGVEYKLRKGRWDSEIHRAFGARVVLAAGASTSPIILRDSGMQHIVNRGF